MGYSHSQRSKTKQKFHVFFFWDCQVALQDPSLISVFDALEISVEDAWNLFRTLDSDPWIRKKNPEMVEINGKKTGGKKRQKKSTGEFLEKMCQEHTKSGTCWYVNFSNEYSVCLFVCVFLIFGRFLFLGKKTTM